MSLRRCATKFGARQPRLFRLAGCATAFGNFTAGLVKLGLYLICEFKLLFKKIINPRTYLFDLGT